MGSTSSKNTAGETTVKQSREEKNIDLPQRDDQIKNKKGSQKTAGVRNTIVEKRETLNVRQAQDYDDTEVSSASEEDAAPRRRSTDNASQAKRELERDVRMLQRQEKEIQRELQNHVKAGRMKNANVAATDLHRTRGTIENLGLTQTQVRSLELRSVQCRAVNNMQRALVRGTEMMMADERKFNANQMQLTAEQFKNHSIAMNERDAMVNEAMSEVFDQNGSESEAVQLLLQQTVEAVMLSQPKVPGNKGMNQLREENDEVPDSVRSADFENRFEALKRTQK